MVISNECIATVFKPLAFSGPVGTGVENALIQKSLAFFQYIMCVQIKAWNFKIIICTISMYCIKLSSPVSIEISKHQEFWKRDCGAFQHDQNHSSFCINTLIVLINVFAKYKAASKLIGGCNKDRVFRLYGNCWTSPIQTSDSHTWIFGMRIFKIYQNDFEMEIQVKKWAFLDEKQMR